MTDTDTTQQTDVILNLDDVVAILKTRYGVPAFVQMTGGGVATIFAGEQAGEKAHTDEEQYGLHHTFKTITYSNGSAQVRMCDGACERYPVIAGPGWFETTGYGDPRASTAEFYIGPDDDGEAEAIATDSRPLEWDEGKVAAEIARQITEPHRPKAEDDFLRALGDFYRAGIALVDKWDGEGFNADERWPLPAELRPPMSLDDWLPELMAHYHDRRETR